MRTSTSSWNVECQLNAGTQGLGHVFASCLLSGLQYPSHAITLEAEKNEARRNAPHDPSR
jgi:hypothetical protein